MNGSLKTWYTCKVKHNREMEDGMVKQVTDTFMLDAVSYSDAETRMYEICEEEVSGEFSVTQITKTNISEILADDSCDKWYKSKVVYATVDGDSEKEVKINTYLLVAAEHIRNAFDKLENHLNAMLVPYEIPSITLTPILEVYPYASEEKIPDNLKPLDKKED